jgi:hypothetical protein
MITRRTFDATESWPVPDSPIEGIIGKMYILKSFPTLNVLFHANVLILPEITDIGELKSFSSRDQQARR